MNLVTLHQNIKQGKLFYTRHAIQRMSERFITPEMVESAILGGEVIEEYPDDKYGLTCLIAAELPTGWLHVVISMKISPWVITTYVPDPEKWIDFKKRKP